MSSQHTDSAASIQTQWFRVLSYYFSVSWNTEPIGTPVSHLLQRFTVDRDPDEERKPATPCIPPRYALTDFGDREELRYRLLYCDELLWGSDALGPVLDHFYWHVNSEAMRHTGDFLLFHAGVVATPHNGAILLPGPSGAGKTTLVAALVRAGFDYLSDEAAAIDPVAHRVYPYPKALGLKDAVSLSILPEAKRSDAPAGRHWDAEEIRPGALAHGPRDVRALLFPSYRSAARTTVTELSAGEAALELGLNGINLSLYGSRALPVLSDLAKRSQRFLLTYGDLKQAVEAISRLTESWCREDSRQAGEVSPKYAK